MGESQSQDEKGGELGTAINAVFTWHANLGRFGRT
jgi:hypothetical protein